MTWTARFTVQDISDGPAPIDVLAVVSADDTYEAVFVDTPGAEPTSHTYPALVSNTEGKIRSAELHFTLDQNDTTLKVGDVIQVQGHFQS